MKKGKYEAWIDGSFKDVYGQKHIGIGGVLKFENKTIFSFNKHMVHTEGTSNSAEYLALLEMLHFIVDNKIKDPVLIRGDSRLVVNQMNNIWDMKQGVYIEYAFAAKKILDSLKNVHIRWTSRHMNKEADYLSKVKLKKNE